MSERKYNPWRIGWESAKANRLPAAVLWVGAAALVLAYYSCPCVSSALEPLRRFQADYGVFAAVVNQVLFCGLVPCAFMLTVREIHVKHPVLKAVLQSAWCGMWGAVYVGLYGFQCTMFGTGHDFFTLLAKTAFDQFVWSPLVPVPLSSVFFLWMGADFSLSTTLAKFRNGFISRVWLPNIVASWCVWIPVGFAVYAFPVDLQVPVLALVSSFWTLMCLQLGKRVAGK